jgi:hypothetical protein
MLESNPERRKMPIESWIRVANTIGKLERGDIL